MADSLIVKLGADTSEFRGKVEQAWRDVSNPLGHGAGEGVGDKFIEAFSHKLLSARHLSGVLATALGLNIEHIAENLAREITGVSKDEEEALKKMGDLSEKLTEVTKKTMESQLSEEKLYQLKLDQREALLKKLADNQGKTTKEKNEALETQIALEENVAELNRLQNSLQEKSAKEQERFNKLLEEYDRQRAEIDRKAREELAEAERQDKEYIDHKKKDEKELHDLKIQAMKPEEQLNALAADRAALAQTMLGLQKNTTEYMDAQVELQKLDNEISAKGVEIEKEKTAEIKEQNKERMNATIDLGVAKTIGGIQIYSDAGRQYDYDQALLASATRDTQRDIDALQKQIDTYKSGGAGIGKYELPALQARLKALQGRQSHIQDYVFNPRYQDAAGQGLFASQVSTIGDPLKLQAKQNDTLKSVAKGIEDINQRLLSAGFGTGK